VRQPIFIAERGTESIGVIGCERTEEPGTARIWSMWVAPSERRRGIGRGLIESALAWARSEGFRKVSLGVTESNAPASELYRTAGFRPTGVTHPLRSDPRLIDVELEVTL
jgi:ribosomal protein S18 acetylase RimI-like enzyme